MGSPTPAVLAGAVSTAIFVVSYMPMLAKAYRTQDLSSYSLGSLVLANVGNAIHSVYVFSLPPGPIWILHTFYLAATGAMLVWHRRWGTPRWAAETLSSPHAAPAGDQRVPRSSGARLARTP